MVPQIAADLLVDVKTAALLSTAFTLPYALTQPVLGTIADFFGKTRLMNMSLLVVSITALICAVATSFSLVFAHARCGRTGRRRRVSGGDGA